MIQPLVRCSEWPAVADGETITLVQLRANISTGLTPDCEVRIEGIRAHVIGPALRVDEDDNLEQQLICAVCLPSRSELRSARIEIAVRGRPLQALRVPVGPSPRSTLAPQIRAADVAIVMATYNPRPEVIKRQIASIKGQTHPDWICLIQDDGSTADGLRAIFAAIGNDNRFHLEVNQSNLGFYHNFERALSRVPVGTNYVALSDQDDHWHPNKLEELAGALSASPEAQLVYSDLRVVDSQGQLLAPTFQAGRSSSNDDPESILISNVVTGCASMFRNRLLEIALPFPRVGTIGYHDHWLAYCAAHTGGIQYVDTALADYYQHQSNVLGARDSDRIRLARVAVLFFLSPIIAATLSFATGRKLLGRFAKVILNQPLEEFALRYAFAETLYLRQVARNSSPTALPDRVEGGPPAWTLKMLLSGRRSGIGFTVVAGRLLASHLIESWLRRSVTLMLRAPRPRRSDRRDSCG